MDSIYILYVDDEPSFGELASDFLEMEDDRIEVVTEVSADDGISRINSGQERIDCIISDYDMPGMDGLDFLEAIRDEYPDIPFILYTGKGSEEIASEAMSKGASDYLQKGSGTEQYTLLANRVRNTVEQYRATQEAKQTRRRLRNLAESTTHCVWMFDRNWEDLLFISGYEEVWNRPTEAIRDNPQDFLKGVHPEDRDFVRNAMERMSNGKAIDIEYRIIRNDDESGWVWVQGEPVFNEDGEVKSVVGFTRDITERKHREQRLERYERIVENLPVGVFRTTPDGEFVDVNEQYISLLDGESESEIADIGAQKFWADPDDREELLHQLEQEGSVESREVEVETLDGESKWVETTLRITEENGDQYLDGIAHDVTERRERRRELEQAETMFENAQDALFLISVNDEFTVERVNTAYEEATGLSNDTLSGRTPRDILGEEQGSKIEQKYRECVEKQTTLEYEEELSINGDQTHWETRISPVLIEGEVKKIVGATRDITNRREREKELNQTTARLEALFEESPDMINVHDMDGNLLDPNPRLCEKTGYDVSELTSMKVWELDQAIDPDEAQALWDGMDVGDRRRLESVYRRRDGSTFPVEVHIRRLRFEGQDRVIVIGRDISERKEHERRAETLIKNFPGIVYRCHNEPGWPTKFVSGNCKTLTGYPSSALEAGDVEYGSDIIHPDNQETVWDSVQAALDERESFELTYRIITRDGTTKWVWEQGQGVWSSDGDLEALEGFVSDITERKERKRELQRYEAYLEGSSDLITVLDDTGTIEYQSPAVERVLGYERDELIGQNGFDYIHPDDEERVWDTFTDLVDEPESTVTVECRFKTVDDDWRWLEVRGTNRLEHDVINGIVTNNRDITEWKHREQELERQNERFDELASAVSHDLQTPLATARGRAELAVETGDTEQIKQALDALERADELRENIVEVLRTKEIVGETEPVNIEQVGQAAWETVSPPDNDSLEVNEAPNVLADAGAVQRLIENLFSNAIEHGNKDITVRIGGIDDGFYIEDDGPGIPEDERDTVFTPGYSTKEGGSGVGLASVRQIIVAHDWEVHITDSSDGGARFEISDVEMA